MKTTPEALKDLFVALGNSADAVADLNQNVDVLNAFAEAYQGSGDAVTIPEAIENITAVADNIGGGGVGGSDFTTATLTITFAADASFEAAILMVPIYNEDVITNYVIIEQSNTEVNVLLPENGTLVILPCTDDEFHVITTTVLTGDSTVDEISGNITITGNASLELGSPK